VVDGLVLSAVLRALASLGIALTDKNTGVLQAASPIREAAFFLEGSVQ